MRENPLWEVAFSTSDNLPATGAGAGGVEGVKMVVQPHPHSRVLESWSVLSGTPRLLLQSA